MGSLVFLLLLVLLLNWISSSAGRSLSEQVDHALGRPTNSGTGFPMLPGDDEFFIAIANEYGQHICDGIYYPH